MIMVNLHFVRDVVPVSDSNENSGVEQNKVSLGLNINQVAYMTPELVDGVGYTPVLIPATVK